MPGLGEEVNVKETGSNKTRYEKKRGGLGTHPTSSERHSLFHPGGLTFIEEVFFDGLQSYDLRIGEAPERSLSGKGAQTLVPGGKPTVKLPRNNHPPTLRRKSSGGGKRAT